MAEGNIGAATFLMTDIEGSTRLWETLPGRMPGLLVLHDGIVASAVVENGGALVKLRGEGDSHFAVFGRSVDAVAAAVDLQRRLVEDAELAAVPIRVRVGIHAGDATVRSMDYYGPSVNRCARIRGVGLGGQILVSETIMSLVRDALPPGVGLLDLGHHRLRDLLRPERLFQVVAEGLRRDFPELPSLNGSRIPQQFTSFVGRESALAQIGARLGAARLLTLLGTGGMGKTRLAFQAAAEVAPRFADGVVVVELAEVAVDAGVEPAVAAALGVTGDPLDGLRERSLLLVADNCEHVLEGVRAFVRRALREAPGLTVLATSRQTLRLAGEETYEVHPLGLPPAEPASIEELLASEAGRLFVERATAVAPRFEANGANLATVARVCARLDGLPLAIELAAARANVLSPTQIDERLGRRFQLLGGGRRTDEGRHATMRGAIEWSFRMLDPAERTLMGRVAAFRGGWTFDAIETALEGRWDLSDDPLDVLQCLVERSLVTVDDLRGDAARYRLLETIREYALETATPEETEAASAGLFAWADAFATSAREQFEGEDQTRWFDLADAERENLRHAFLWGLGRSELRERVLADVVALSRFFVARGHYALGRSLVEPARDVNPEAPAPLRAKATNLAGVLAMCQGDLDLATARLTEGLDLARSIGDRSAEGATLCNLGMIAWERQDCESARGWYVAAVAALTAPEDRGRLGSALLSLGNVLIDLERLDESREALEASLPLLRERGDLSRLATIASNLGYLAITREDWPEARRTVYDSLRGFGEVGDWKAAMNTLIDAATILLHDGDEVAVATVRGAVERMGRTAQATPTPRDAQSLERIDAALRAVSDTESLRRGRYRGLQMPPQGVVKYALDALARHGIVPDAQVRP